MSRTTLFGGVCGVVILLSSLGAAQVQFDWAATVSGSVPYDEGDAKACASDAAGNVYIAGTSLVAFTSDLITSAIGPTGNLLWSKRVAPGDTQQVTDMGVSPQGDVYVCGYVEYASDAPHEDLLLLKYSATGTLQWLVVYDGPFDSADFAYALDFDASGNVIVAGTTRTPGAQRDVYVVAYSPAGSIVWEQRIDGGAGGIDQARAMTVLRTGEIVIAGFATTSTGHDSAVAKLSANGALLWMRTFDNGGNDGFTKLALAASRIVAVGQRQTSASGEGWQTAEFDSDTGAQLWSAFHDGPSAGADFVRDVAIGSDGTTWVLGKHYDTRTVVLRYDRTGTLLSTVVWPFTNHYSGPAAIVAGDAGQAWVAGTRFQHAAVVQYDNAGNENWVWTSTNKQWLNTAHRAVNNRLVLAGRDFPLTQLQSELLAERLDLSSSPHGYCKAKVTSNGCVPSTSFTGMSSTNTTSGFVVHCEQARNQTNGLLLYGLTGSAALPFHGGTMCIAPPQMRTPIQGSGGNASPASDCSGSFALDMNSYAHGALGGAPPPALLIPGTTVCCQFWGRDPGFAPPLHAMLSNALRYVVLP